MTAEGAEPVPAGAELSQGDALALFTAVIWGATVPLSKPIVDSVQPLVFVTARFGLIAVCLMTCAALTGQNLRLRLSDIPGLIGLGILGFGLAQSVNGVALSLTTASKGAIISATIPVFGALFGRMRGEQGGWSLWLGILLASAGIFLVINNGLTALHFDRATLPGDLLFLVMSALFALYTALSRGALVRYGAIAAGAYLTVFGALSMLPLGIYGALHGPVLPHDPRLWINFAFVVLGSGTLGFITWYTAVIRLGASRTLVYFYLVPIFALLGSVLFLGDPFSTVQAIGSALVFIGVVVARQGAALFGRLRAKA